MATAAVTPGTAATPTTSESVEAPLPPVSPAALFDTWNVESAAVSDWMHHYESPISEDDLYLMVEEIAREQFSGGNTDNGRPKWTVDSTGKDVKITFGDSREKVWTVAKDEIESYRNRVKRMSGKSFEEMDPIKDVMELYLGKFRPVMQLFQSALSLSYERACHFLGTYCTAKAYRLSTAELYSSKRVETSDLMTEAEYRAVWELISKAKTSEGRNKKHFWKRFEERMNETFLEVNISIMGSLIVSLDDDKKKASVGKGHDMQGLKQHVLSDRRKGIVGHTAVSPATLLTLGVCWEMQGESAYECYVKLVKEIFGQPPNLDKVTFCSDRGYWILDLVKFILANGGDVHGTVKRQHWYGWTFDTELKEGDSRINVKKAGPAALYTATGEISDRVVSIQAFRNGTNGVATTMSSVVHGAHWEFVVNKSMCHSDKHDNLVYTHEFKRAQLFRLAGNNAVAGAAEIRMLGALSVDHVTEYQGHQEWFHARKFSTTSKTVANQVPLQLKLDREREERREHWVILEQYLDKNSGVGATLEINTSDGSGSAALGAAGVTDESENSTTDESENGTTDAGAFSRDEQHEGNDDAAAVDLELHVDEQRRIQAKEMIDDATDTTERNQEFCRSLIDELKSGGHKDILVELVKQMGGRPCKTHTSNCNTAIKWLESDPAKRPYVFLTVPQLKVRLVHNGDVFVDIISNLTIPLSLFLIIHTGQV